MERYIELDDGTIFEIQSCSVPDFYSKRNLYIVIVGSQVQDVVIPFSDKTKTKTIKEYYNGEQINTYIGYVNLVGLTYDIGSNNINLNLMQPENEADGVWEL